MKICPAFLFESGLPPAMENGGEGLAEQEARGSGQKALDQGEGTSGKAAADSMAVTAAALAWICLQPLDRAGVLLGYGHKNAPPHSALKRLDPAIGACYTVCRTELQPLFWRGGDRANYG